MKDESLGRKTRNWRGPAGSLDDNEETSSKAGNGGEEIPEAAENWAEGVGCMRQTSMLEEGKRRIAVAGGGGEWRLLLPVAVSAGANRFVDRQGWQHLGGVCWWYSEREEVDD